MELMQGWGQEWYSSDNYAGAGVVESVFQFADSCTRAGEGDVAEIAMNAGAMGLDALGTMLDPLGSLATAGLGWLIEHVSFLREPLDWLAGDPDEIKAAVATWNDTALKLEDIGKQQDQALRSQVQSWEQVAADAFRKSHGQLGREMKAMGVTCTAVADEISNAGTIVATIRGTIRDLISQFVWEVVRNSVIALATSTVTFGAAAAAFAAWTVGRGAIVLGKITQMITKVISVITRVMGRLKGLFGSLGDMFKGLERFGRGGSAPGAPAPTRSAGVDTPAATTPSSGAPSTPDSPGLGQRMEDWGRAKAKPFEDAFKDSGNKWKEMYEDKWEQKRWNRLSKTEGAVDAYTPFKQKEYADGSVSAMSRPSVMDGAFQTKFAGDLLREEAKEDELRNEISVPEGMTKEQEDVYREQQAARLEDLREQ